MVRIPKAVSTFVSRYLVTIVMVPTIIGLHIGWSAVQKNRALVREDEEIELPVITFYKYCLRKLKDNNDTPANKVAKVENP